MKKYYALYDMQVGRYLQTGINSTCKKKLLKDFIDYVSVDFELDDFKTMEDKKHYYFTTYEGNPKGMFEQWDYELEEGAIPFVEDER